MIRVPLGPKTWAIARKQMLDARSVSLLCAAIEHYAHQMCPGLPVLHEQVVAEDALVQIEETPIGPSDPYVVVYSYAIAKQQPQHLIDAGCGHGLRLLTATRHPDQKPPAMTLVDVSPENLAIAAEAFSGLDVTFVQADLCTTDAALRADCIVCGEVLEHVTSPHTALTTLYSWLDPGGLLVCSTPNRVAQYRAGMIEPNGNPRNSVHRREWAPWEFVSIIANTLGQVLDEVGGVWPTNWDRNSAPPPVWVPMTIPHPLWVYTDPEYIAFSPTTVVAIRKPLHAQDPTEPPPGW